MTQLSQYQIGDLPYGKWRYGHHQLHKLFCHSPPPFLLMEKWLGNGTRFKRNCFGENEELFTNRLIRVAWPTPGIKADEAGIFWTIRCISCLCHSTPDSKFLICHLCEEKSIKIGYQMQISVRNSF